MKLTVGGDMQVAPPNAAGALRVFGSLVAKVRSKSGEPSEPMVPVATVVTVCAPRSMQTPVRVKPS